MTRSERERQIERYISGGMSPAEEQDFFIQAALDRELRFELKALMTVDSAIRKDREAEPVQHTALRSRVAAMLVAAPPVHEPAPAAAPHPAAPHPAAPVAGTIQKILPIQWISFVAATMALTAVLFILVDRPPSGGTTPPRYEQTGNPAGQTVPGTTTGPAPSQEHLPSEIPASTGTGVGSTPETPSEAAAAHHGATASPSEQVNASVRSSQRKEGDLPERAAPIRSADPSQALDQQQRSDMERPNARLDGDDGRDNDETLGPSKRGSDTLSVGVKIRLNKKSQQE